MRPTFSVIVPVYDPENKMKEIVQKCLSSIWNNSTNFELIVPKNIRGFPRAVNWGLHRAKGEHIVVVNDDIEIKDSQWLYKLMGENAISSWRLIPFFITGELTPDGACWAMSKEVYEKIGDMDERFNEGYGFDDNDYWERAKREGVIFRDASVRLQHLGSQTFKNYFSDLKESMTERNATLFAQKWHMGHP